MTTAHRPTFDPARGKEAQRGPAYHQRLLPAHTHLKLRQPGQGGEANREFRDLKSELLQAEAAHFARLKGEPLPITDTSGTFTSRRAIENGKEESTQEEGPESKRRRILEESRELDADSDLENEDSEDNSDDEDDEDETAELQRELEKIKRERAEKRDQEERDKAAQEEARRERDIAFGNPLLNPKSDFNLVNRWDDDVVFKNQARGSEIKGKKEFVNDLLRSDFHKRFMR